MTGSDTVPDDFARYVADSPTSYHAAAAARDRFVAAGFTALEESAEWPTAPGGYVVVRDGAVVAWRVPAGAGPTTPFRVLGAHTDSPGFRLKPHAVVRADGWERLNVEVYGGPILGSWFDRDLAVAGRVVDPDGTVRLVRTEAVARIPHVAIHLERTDDFRPDRQRHLLPVVGVDDGSDPADVRHWLREALGDAVAGDLFLADTQPAARIGVGGRLLACGRMDNLTSVHAGLAGLLEAPEDAGHVAVLAAFDHEEVGSASTSGAAGPLLEDVVGRIQEGLGASRSEAARALRGSWLLSSDAGHLVHPGHPEKHDPGNRPRPGGGPLLKVSATQRYTTDARGEALFAATCAAAGVPWQHYVNVNTIPGGSTIGPLAATRLGIPTVDVGVGLLSMHSARELVHVDDLVALHAAVAAFLAG
nr:M18 family aminopeptidase [Phycicoccus flavus]